MPVTAPAKVVTGMRAESQKPAPVSSPETGDAASIARSKHEDEMSRQLMTPVHPHTASPAAVAAGFAQPGQITDQIVETKVYFSSVPNYLLSLWDEPDYYVGGRLMTGKRVVARWEGHLFATSSLRTQQIIEAHPEYGLGGAMWDVELGKKAAAEGTLEALKEQFRSNPDAMIAALSDQLGGEDFDLIAALQKKAKSEKREKSEQPQ